MDILLIYAVAAGSFLSLQVISAKVAFRHKVHVLHLALTSGFWGAVIFLPGLITELRGTDLGFAGRAILFGVINGSMRYFGLLLWKYALSVGPMAPMVCVNCLGFMMVIPYVWLFYHQIPEAMHWLALGIAAATLIVAVFNVSPKRESGSPRSNKGLSLLYLAVLLAIWVAGGIGTVMVKEMNLHQLEDGISELARFGTVFWFFEHFALFVFASLHFLYSRKEKGAPSSRAIALGLVSSGGSFFGVRFVKLGIVLPPAVFFSTSHVTIICIAAVTGALFFQEPRSILWYLTIIGSIAVVGLANFAM